MYPNTTTPTFKWEFDPPDWNPTSIADLHTVGVDLFRADSNAAWQYLGIFAYPLEKVYFNSASQF
jgi:hypothetical protein